MLRLCLQSRHCTVLHYTEETGGNIVGEECGDWSLTRLACRTLHIPVIRLKVLVRGLLQAFWGAELHAERHGLLLRGASIVNFYLRWDFALHFTLNTCLSSRLRVEQTSASPRCICCPACRG